MTLPKDSGIFGVKDLEILKLLSDVAGQAPTFDAAIAAPGIKSLKMAKNVKEVESRGDEKVLDTEEVFQYLDVSWDNERVSMDVIAAIGGTQTPVNAPGSPETNSIIESGDDIGNYFQIRCKSKKGTNGVKQVGVQIYKVRGTLTYDMVGEGYANSSFKGKALACQGTIEGVVAPYRKLIYSSGAVAFGAGAVKQVETATVVGTITTAGNATFTVTGAGITGSPKAISVPVALGDSAAVVALKAAEVLGADAAVIALYDVAASGATLILTAKAAAANDATLNIASTNGTCAGLTPAATSANTTAGQLPT